MITRKLKNHSGCNCKIKIEKDENGLCRIVFISYITPIIYAEELPREMEDLYGFRIYCADIKNPNTGKFSRTTARQIGYFLKEYFMDLKYQDMKEIQGMDDFRIGHLSKSDYETIKELI